MRDKGDSLTTEKLAKLDPDQIVEEILTKAGVVHFTRVYRIVLDVCTVKKVSMPSYQELLLMLLLKSYVLVDKNIFISKSELCYTKVDKRAIALRDFIVDSLVKSKEPVSIKVLIEKTKSNFRELGPILDNVASKSLKAKGLVFEAFYSLKVSQEHGCFEELQFPDSAI